MVTHLLPPFPVDGSHMRIEDISGRYIRNPLQKDSGVWQISSGFTCTKHNYNLEQLAQNLERNDVLVMIAILIQWYGVHCQ